jgi:hypothetical protein
VGVDADIEAAEEAARPSQFVVERIDGGVGAVEVQQCWPVQRSIRQRLGLRGRFEFFEFGDDVLDIVRRKRNGAAQGFSFCGIGARAQHEPARAHQHGGDDEAGQF